MTTPWEEMAQLVTELAVQTTDDENHDGPALLTRLRRAVWGDIGRTMERAGGNGLPIDQGAHILLTDLDLEIEGAYSQVTGRRGSTSAVGNLLAWHCTFGMLIGQGWIDEDMQTNALDKLRGWAQKIRDQFDAPLKVELRDFHCPNCGESRARWWDRDLELEGAAVVITLDDEMQLIASCRNRDCHHLGGERSQWIGDAEVLYMARRAGIDVDALAGEIREARKPTEAEYVPPDEKQVEPFDPRNPEHIALLGGGAA